MYNWITLLYSTNLKKEIVTHSSILAWKIPWTEEHGGLQSMGSQESATTEHIGTAEINTL